MITDYSDVYVKKNIKQAENIAVAEVLDKVIIEWK